MFHKRAAFSGLWKFTKATYYNLIHPRQLITESGGHNLPCLPVPAASKTQMIMNCLSLSLYIESCKDERLFTSTFQSRIFIGQL